MTVVTSPKLAGSSYRALAGCKLRAHSTSPALLAAVADGELTPSEAAELGKLVDAHAKAIEVTCRRASRDWKSKAHEPIHADPPH